MILSGVIFTISCIPFLVFQLISHIIKEKFSTLISRINVFMVTLLLSNCIFCIAAYLSVVYYDNLPMFELFFRLDWFTKILLFSMSCFFLILSSTKTKIDKMKDLIFHGTFNTMFSIITVIFLLAVLLLPHNRISATNYNFLLQPMNYIFIAYVIIVELNVVLNTTSSEVKIDKNGRMGIVLIFVCIGVFVLLSYLFTDIVLFDFGYTIVFYISYFSIFNQDLKFARETKDLKDNIEKNSRAKTEFLANMSKEIRGPIEEIVGFSDSLLKDEFDKEKIVENLDNIKLSGTKLLEVTDNVLDYSKMEYGSFSLDVKTYSISNLIIEWSSLVNKKIKNKNIKFELNVDNKIPAKLSGDSSKIYQIVLNILNNSVKFSEVGKITLNISQTMLNDGNVKLSFVVTDTGEGMSEEVKARVNKTFNNPRINRNEIRGLGLVLIKRYADLMGGTVWFESEESVGTKFYFDVIQKIIDVTPIGSIVDSIANANNRQLLDCSKFTALVVDEDPLNLEVTRRILSKYKFNVVTLQTGKECIFRYKSGEHYDIMFLDHMMPDMDGVELLVTIKSLKDYDCPPIVALTANAIAGSRKIYLDEGFDDYIPKPIDLNELDQVINKYLKDK